MPSDFWINVIIFLVILHFIAGFGYMVYKLSFNKEDKEKEKVEDKKSLED